MRPPASLLTIAVLSGLIAAPAAGAEPTARHLTLLHVNDVYEIAPGRGGRGGFGPLARMIAEREPALVTFGGDLLSPSVLSSLTQGAHMIALMNAIGTDVAVPGNHEFDFGPAVFARRAGDSAFPWLAANMTGVAPVSARTIRDAAGIKVGIFGLITPETATSSSPGGGVSFSDPVAAAREQVAALRAEGAEVIVALTHLPLPQDMEVAAVPGIDVVLGGHDHEPWSHHDGDTLILKAGTNAEFLGVVDLAVDRGERTTTVTPAWSLLPVRGASLPQVAEQVAGYQAALDAEMASPLATTRTPLDSRRANVRGQEAAIGNLITDAMRAATGADAAITNGGGIRGNRTYEAGARLTRGDVLTELPFGNVVEVLDLSGADLRAALEHGLSAIAEEGGRFPQVSGLAVTFDPAAPAGNRVRTVMVGGAPLEAGATYAVAVNDYIGGGGDGYAMLADAPRRLSAEAGPLLATVVMEYLKAATSVAPAPEGRITAQP